MNILVLEDDKKISTQIAESLTQELHHVSVAHDGAAGLSMALDRGRSFDAIVLDLMLPGSNGLTVVQTLRQYGVATPVLMVSALGSVDDRVRGLDAGGDDYLVKPFSLHELSARIRALARRGHGPAAREQTSFTIADLSVDLLTRRVERGGKLLDLPPNEYDLLVLLLQNAGRPVTHNMILERVWDWTLERQRNLVDVLVYRLRRAIDRDFETKLIHTVRGSGYVLRAHDPREAEAPKRVARK